MSSMVEHLPNVFEAEETGFRHRKIKEKVQPRGCLEKGQPRGSPWTMLLNFYVSQGLVSER